MKLKADMQTWTYTRDKKGNRTISVKLVDADTGRPAAKMRVSAPGSFLQEHGLGAFLKAASDAIRNLAKEADDKKSA